MVDFHPGRPSLFLASRDKAHRGHIHKHHLLHQRNPGSEVQSIVTEIVTTVSVIQQVTVDSTGNILGIQTFTADATGGYSYPITAAASSGATNTGSVASSTGAGDQLANNAASSASSQSLLSIQNVESASTTTPTSSIPTTFASLFASSNTTTLISSSNTLTPSFSNSSTSLSVSSNSSPSSSSTDRISSATSSITFSTSSSSASSSSASSSSQSASVTPFNTVGGTGVGSGSTSTSTAAAGNGGNSNDSSAPSTSTVVGGVVGGVAGAAIIIFLLMFLIRWKRRHQSMLALGDGHGDDGLGTSRSVPPSGSPGGMAQRSSFGGFAVPAALASLTGYKRSSNHTADRTTMSSTAGSERGFYRVSGRKLPSVLQSGGDGYGGGVGEPSTLSGSSFYRDSQGFHGGPGGPSSPPAGISIQRDSGIPIMREGPARTPVTEQGPFSAMPGPLAPPGRRPDGLGRSHPSMDGSQRSRFTEEV